MEEFVIDNISTYGPIAVFLLLMLSGFGLALGEEMVTIPAGMLIASPDIPLDFSTTLIVAYIAIALSDCMWYGICRHYGTPLLHRRWMKRLIHPRRLLQMKHQLEARGIWFIVIARFVPSSRTTAITVAGMFHMPFWRFALTNAACAMITVPMQLGLGYLVGRQLGSEDMADMLLKILGLIMLIIAATMVIAWYTRHRASRRTAPRAKVAWLRRLRPGARSRSGASAAPKSQPNSSRSAA